MFILHAEITQTILTLWGLIHHRNDPNPDPNINSDNLWFWQTENKGNNNSSMRKFPFLVFKGSFGHVSKIQARGRVRFFPYDDLVVNFTLPYLLLTDGLRDTWLTDFDSHQEGAVIMEWSHFIRIHSINIINCVLPRGRSQGELLTWGQSVQ